MTVVIKQFNTIQYLHEGPLVRPRLVGAHWCTSAGSSDMLNEGLISRDTNLVKNIKFHIKIAYKKSPRYLCVLN